MALALGLTNGRLGRIRFSTVVQLKYDSVLDLFNGQPLGSSTTVKGWVKQMRKMKNITFINVNDGSCCDSIQIVLSKALVPKDLSIGSSVIVSGQLTKTPKGQLEISGENINLLGRCLQSEGFPFTYGQKHPFDYCRQYLHHRPTLAFFSSLMRARHAVTCAVHKYFGENKFVGVHTPILTSNDCEGAGETFMVRPSSETLLKQLMRDGRSKEQAFFNTKAFLTVSGQFHLESVARSIPKVYTFNPTFRAENSKSRVHLSEFYMVEAEEAFVESVTDILPTMEGLVKSLTSRLISECEKDVDVILENNESESKYHLSSLRHILDKPFAVMTYKEAKDVINKHRDLIKYEKPADDGFSKEEELFLVNHNDSVPVFVINWPKELKPFYAKACRDKPNEVEAVDLLAPVVGELCGGSMREDDPEALREKLENLNLVDQLEWYLELRKFGNVPTGGFGMGFERFLQFALNIYNIKDTIPFPRYPHNLKL